MGKTQRRTRFDSVEKGATAVEDGVDSIAESVCVRHAACREMRATGLSRMRHVRLWPSNGIVGGRDVVYHDVNGRNVDLVAEFINAEGGIGSVSSSIDGSCRSSRSRTCVSIISSSSSSSSSGSSSSTVTPIYTRLSIRDTL